MYKVLLFVSYDHSSIKGALLQAGAIIQVELMFLPFVVRLCQDFGCRMQVKDSLCCIIKLLLFAWISLAYSMSVDKRVMKFHFCVPFEDQTKALY